MSSNYRHFCSVKRNKKKKKKGWGIWLEVLFKLYLSRNKKEIKLVKTTCWGNYVKAVIILSSEMIVKRVVEVTESTFVNLTY